MHQPPIEELIPLLNLLENKALADLFALQIN